ncbi:MAG: tetratricopeptide repeat protein, partial [Gammaproteobacteria bacterium]
GSEPDRFKAAKESFEQTTSRYHLPSATARGADREKLLKKAAAGYNGLLRDYRDQPYWCAQALRSLGNVRAAQGRLDEAVTLYSQVATQYSSLDWEVLQAWKSAGDLLWDAGRVDAARRYYDKIVAKYDKTEDPAIVKLIVRASKSRLADS